MLLSFFNLHACALIYNKSWHIGAVSKKNISDRPFWRDFWGPKMLKNPNFLGLRPGSHWGAQSLSSLRELHCSPDLLAGGKGTRCPCPITPLPFLAFRLGLASTSQGLIHYRVVCCQYCKYDYYTTNTQQCIFLLAIVLHFNPKTFTVDHLYSIVTQAGPI